MSDVKAPRTLMVAHSCSDRSCANSPPPAARAAAARSRHSSVQRPDAPGTDSDSVPFLRCE
jgi:hypothetical protein